MSEERRKQSWTNKSIPYLISIAIFMLGTLINTTNKIDDKLFKHLTNDEMHVLRNTVVSRGEFDIITKMRDAQLTRIDNKLNDIEMLLRQARGK